MHTHLQTEGVLHVESPTQESFSLGQFFAVWGVRLDADVHRRRVRRRRQAAAHVGQRHAGRGDPTRIVLDEHQEIVIAVGTPAQVPDPVPSSYDFPAGL